MIRYARLWKVGLKYDQVRQVIESGIKYQIW